MNKKKVAGLLLAGALLIGGTGLGSYAWFTDRADASANLKITTGTLDVEIDKEGGWEVVPRSHMDKDLEPEINKVTNEEGEVVFPDNDFTNVRPGDVFIKTYTIKNEGSLKQRVTIKTIEDSIPQEYKDILKVEAIETNDTQDGAKDNVIVLPPKGQVDSDGNPLNEHQIQIALSLSGPNTGNDWQNTTIDLNLNAIPFVEVEATQVNNK